MKYAFEIDYFEQYRNQSINKKLSELHRHLADRLLARSEWEAAASAYKDALQINPNNAAAAENLVKAEVFLPLPQQKYAAPEIIDAKLQYLETLFPHDYIVPFLKGVRGWEMGDYEMAQKMLEQSVAMNPDFPGGYLVLGYIAQNRLDLESAIKNYLKALSLDPLNAQALNNLGFMYLLSGRYKEAVEHLSRSENISPTMLTGINLGDAYRYMGNNKPAKDIHKMVLKDAEGLVKDYERYWGGEWTYNLMPLTNNDTETIKRYIWARTRDQKLAIAHFALALDHAIDADISNANNELEKAMQLEGEQAYRMFYANKIAFLQSSLDIKDPTKRWFAEQRAKLSSR